LDKAVENELADLLERSAAARDMADEIEQEVGAEAKVLIDQFLAGDITAFACCSSLCQS
jgi:hypothetical protein